MTQPETPEQREMRSTVRTLLTRAEPIASARAAEGDHTAGFDRDVWKHLAEDVGVTALLVPEEAGGLGLSFADAAIVLEEMGRAAYNGPGLETAVLAPAVLGLADQDVSEDWDRLASGTRIATAAGIDTLVARTSRTSVTATTADGRWTLSGELFGVPHGHVADVVYVVAESDGGRGLWAVEADAPGHQRAPLETLDLTRPMTLHHLEGAPARLVRSPGADPAGLRDLAALAATALGAEQVGAASYVLAETVEYVRTRYQFGRSIGSFQAVKHRCVNMSVAVEGATAASGAARAAVDAAREGAGDGPHDELVRLAAVAGAFCSEAVVDVAGAALQLHGGIGMSWEHDIHVHLRRAKSSQRLYGSPADHRRTLRHALGLVPAAVG